MSIRNLLFWSHLTAGCAGGLIILTMSVTGVVLTYERQILARVERGPFRSTPPAGQALPVEELLARVAAQGAKVSAGATLTARSAAGEPIELAIAREPATYIDPYTGRILGRASPKWRSFFQNVTAWHRWLGAKGEGRTTAKAITGACNLAFVLLIVTGPFLWLPKQWTRRNLAPIAWFRRGLSGKARDFNWHNTIGIWCAAPLLVVVVCATPMSYQWANNLVYRITGTEPPAPARPAGDGPAATGTVDPAGLNALWDRAISQERGWRSVAMRLPEARRPVLFTIDTGDGGQPQKRSTLTLDRATGAVVRHETFAGNSAGRRLRSWTRFAHTGEAFGIPGQTIAGIASAGGAVLVWTGIALSLRRLGSRRRRRARVEARAEAETVMVD